MRGRPHSLVRLRGEAALPHPDERGVGRDHGDSKPFAVTVGEV